MTHCKARQYSDQMLCSTCGLAWDVNDAEPPACRQSDPVRDRYNRLRGELAVGCLVCATRYKYPRKVVGWTQRDGLLYFKLAGLAEPVRASSCKSC